MLSVLLCIVILALVWRKLTAKSKDFPPGPFRWPVIGNMLEFKRSAGMPHEVVGRLSQQYGNIVGIHLILNPVVIVSGLEEIKELLAHPDCQGRPPGAVRLYENDVTGILFTQGEVWREQRRFALRHLRDLGLGKRELETLIHEEVRDLLQDVQKRAGKDYSTPVDAIDLVNATGANVIFHMLAGERFQRGEPELNDLINMIKTTTTVNDASGGVTNAFPFLLKYAKWMTEYYAIKKAKMPVIGFLKNKINEHQNSYHENSRCDFIDFYLEQMKKESPDSAFHFNQLLTVCYDLFVAGSDTTVGALSFALLYMLLQPKVQERVQQELDEVVGRDRLPSLDDKQRLVYVNAVLQETLRMANVVAISVPHATTSEVNFRGYIIPKDTRIIVNLYGLQMDPNIWGDPENFRPERFIGPKGELLTHEALLPFGQGKRVCLGESLARSNLFLTFSALLQNFMLSIPEGQPPPSRKQEGGFVLTPNRFFMKLTPRKK